MLIVRWTRQVKISVLILVQAGLFLAPVSMAMAEAPAVTLSIEARDGLPGFRKADEADYLTDRMRETNLKGWAFTPAPAPSIPPRDRIEWRFELDPFAGGSVRQFFPMPGVQKIFGARHRVTAEAMLYLDDEYQTLVFGQATIAGGAQDKDLADFVTRMTRDLLGEKGAYRSIDMGPAAKP
ncbi:MAG TPA: hypothetical protein VGM68_05620 [Rhizomicrobium sp.]|jgi:hypothetical protein